MPVVVTGAAGFIGRHVVRALLAGGTAVVGIDRRAWVPDDGETTLLTDLAAPSPAAVEWLRAADGVIHLAGRPGVRDPRPDIAVLRHRDNVLAGARVLAATPPTTPLVVASSSSVYGGSRRGRPCREDDRLRPIGGYAASKVALERLCAARAATGGHVGVVRPFTVAGEGQRADMAISRWIAAAREGRPLTILGDPARTRDVTDVRDVAAGILRMLHREVTGTVNLGTGVGRTLGGLAATVAAALGVPLRLEQRPAAPDEVRRTLADTRRCARVLGFVPRTSLPDLVARQIAADRPAPAPVPVSVEP